VALDDRLGDVHELAAVVLRMVAEHFERVLLVDRVARHQDALRLLDQRPPPERSLQVVVLGEALEGDIDRALQLLGIGVDDVGEDAALGRLRGRGITVAGTPERGAVVQQAKELVAFARRQGYRLDELVEIIQHAG